MSNPPPVSSLLDFTGKVALVTGSGSGLGRAIALRFAEAGARVVVHYHASAEGAHAVAQRCWEAGAQAKVFGADLTRAAEVDRLLEQTVAEFGRLDVLINNTGVFPAAEFLEMSQRQWDDLLAVDLRSAFLCTQAAARQMIAQGGGGALVNVTSIEAAHPALAHSHYAAAKGGLDNFTRAAACELAPHGIRVNGVAPGLIWREGIETDWPEGVARWEGAAPLKRLGQPDDVADACLFLASPAARWITGASLTVDGGISARALF